MQGTEKGGKGQEKLVHLMHEVYTRNLDLRNGESILSERLIFHKAKLTSGAALDPSGHVSVAICHGFALFVAVSVGANISRGHVNPAVTFGLALGGQITLLTGIFYWIAQLLGSIVACYLLKVVTGGGSVSLITIYITSKRTY